MIDLNKVKHDVLYHEERGLLTKYWVSIDGQKYLFKTNYLTEADCETVTKTNFGEVLYSHLAKKFNFPCVEAELAVGKIYGKEVEGVLVKSFLHSEMEDSMGYKDMANFVSRLGYSPKNESNIDACASVAYYMAKYQDRTYDEATTRKDLAKLCIVDYFLGQGDRHGRNIEYIFDENFNLKLAPFFDNGFCLGFKYPKGLVNRYLNDPACQATNDFFGDPPFFFVTPYEKKEAYKDKEDLRRCRDLSNIIDIIKLCDKDAELKKLVDGFINLDIRSELEAINDNSKVQLPKEYIDFCEIIYKNRVAYYEKTLNNSKDFTDDKNSKNNDDVEMGL